MSDAQNSWQRVRVGLRGQLVCCSRSAVVAGFGIFLFVCATDLKAQPARQLTEASEKLQKLVSTLPPDSDESRGLRTQLEEVDSAIASHHYFFGLYRLQVTWTELFAQKYRADRSETEKKGMAAFEEEWRRLGLDLNQKEKALSNINTRKVSSVVVALSQASQNQVRPYYQSGRLYGMNTTVGEGLYYLGRAPANLEFALFALQLPFANPGRRLQFKSLSVALATLETETLQSYRAPGASKRQPEYNNLNSKLKMAGELNKSGLYEGAFEKLLEASLVLGRLNASGSAQSASQLKERNATIGRELKESKFDESIGLLFWEMAEHLLNKTDEASVRTAQVIIERVLPQYKQYAAEFK